MSIENVFNGISAAEVKRYTRYWKSVAPKNTDDVFRRWLFAYTSIHTNWEGNVRGYNAIKNFHEWENDKALLKQKLIDARCGLYNNRTEFIWKFKEQFFGNPQAFLKSRDEQWVDVRNRLTKVCHGIGIAKVSFTLEMCFPDKAEVVCLDTHMIQLYDLGLQKFDAGKGKILYEAHERDWIERSSKIGASPYIARCIFWDKKQNQQDSRYWSHVLEA